MTTARRFRLLAVHVLAWTVLAMPALAQSDKGALLLDPVTRSEQEAVEAGFERRSFDFGVPAISFSALLPKGAEVEASDVGATRLGDEMVARIVVAGKFTHPDAELPLTGTVVAVRRAYPLAPAPICRRQLLEIDYTPMAEVQLSDLSAAQCIGIKRGGDSQMWTGVNTVLTRGDWTLSLWLDWDISSAPDVEARKTMFAQASEMIGAFIASMRFEDGKPSALTPGSMTAVSLALGAERIDFDVPAPWEPIIDDFGTGKAQPPAEYQIARKKDGRIQELVALSVLPGDGKGDVESIGPDLARTFVAGLSPSIETVKIVKRDDIRAYKKAGIPAAEFVLRAYSVDGEEVARAESTLIASKRRLYFLTRFIPDIDQSGQAAFYTLQSGRTAFGLMQQGVRRHLTDK